MKISVIMPSFNQASFVEAAIRSVLEQDYPDKELIFCDGGSTDGTVQIAERYRDRISYFVSEPDQGQSDALRKGFAQATGDFLTWLNTDDLLLPGALSRVANQARRQPDREWFTGNVAWIAADGSIIKLWQAERYLGNLAARLGFFAAGGPSSFFSRRLYTASGGLSLDMHYMMDSELWWRFIAQGARFTRLSGYTWALRLHENAKMSGHLFADPDSPGQRRIAAAKTTEAARVEEVRRHHGWRLPAALGVAWQAATRLSSPHYLASRWDTLRWRGQPLSRFLERAS